MVFFKNFTLALVVSIFIPVISDNSPTKSLFVKEQWRVAGDTLDIIEKGDGAAKVIDSRNR